MASSPDASKALGSSRPPRLSVDRSPSRSSLLADNSPVNGSASPGGSLSPGGSAFDLSSTGGASPFAGKKGKKRRNYTVRCFFELSDSYTAGPLIVNVLQDTTALAVINTAIRKQRAFARRDNTTMPNVRSHECAFKLVGPLELQMPGALPIKLVSGLQDQLLSLRIPYLQNFSLCVFLDPAILAKKFDEEIQAKKRALVGRADRRKQKTLLSCTNAWERLEVELREDLGRTYLRFVANQAQEVVDAQAAIYTDVIHALREKEAQDARDCASDRRFFNRLALRKAMHYSLECLDILKNARYCHKQQCELVASCIGSFSNLDRLRAIEFSLINCRALEHRLRMVRTQKAIFSLQLLWGEANEAKSRVRLRVQEQELFSEILEWCGSDGLVINNKEVATQRWERKDRHDKKVKLIMKTFEDRIDSEEEGRERARRFATLPPSIRAREIVKAEHVRERGTLGGNQTLASTSVCSTLRAGGSPYLTSVISELSVDAPSSPLLENINVNSRLLASRQEPDDFMRNSALRPTTVSDVFDLPRAASVGARTEDSDWKLSRPFSVSTLGGKPFEPLPQLATSPPSAKQKQKQQWRPAVLSRSLQWEASLEGGDAALNFTASTPPPRFHGLRAGR